MAKKNFSSGDRKKRRETEAKNHGIWPRRGGTMSNKEAYPDLHPRRGNKRNDRRG